MKILFETFGCQMNKVDSETAAERLLVQGYELVADAESADVVVFNTCSVREHAEERVYSRIGALKWEKLRRPSLIIAVMGCMAQNSAGAVFRRAPLVDIVCGPRQAARLGDFIAQARAGQRILAIDGGDRIRHHKAPRNVRVLDPADAPPFARCGSVRPVPYQAFVTIMQGCDNFCSYCIVPYVRGPEISRPAEEIIEEINRLVETGAREVTLLGQNVNSYGGGLPSLLRVIHNIPGLDRIRFVTSHPKDVTDDLLSTMAELPGVCNHLHAPAQSGSDSILKLMHRGYTRRQYDDMLERARRIVPDIEIASDFIVGFPGETEQDFEQTVQLVRSAGFNQCFIFKYSPRKGTRAAELIDDVPEEAKKRRNNELLAVQEEVSARRNRAKHGRILGVLVDGPSKSDPSKLAGRSPGYDIVVTEGPETLVGSIIDVRITDSTPLTLFGEIVKHAPAIR